MGSIAVSNVAVNEVDANIAKKQKNGSLFKLRLRVGTTGAVVTGIDLTKTED